MKWPTRQFKIINRLVALSTPVSCPGTVPLSMKKIIAITLLVTDKMHHFLKPAWQHKDNCENITGNKKL